MSWRKVGSPSVWECERWQLWEWEGWNYEILDATDFRPAGGLQDGPGKVIWQQQYVWCLWVTERKWYKCSDGLLFSTTKAAKSLNREFADFLKIEKLQRANKEQCAPGGGRAPRRSP